MRRGKKKQPRTNPKFPGMEASSSARLFRDMRWPTNARSKHPGYTVVKDVWKDPSSDHRVIEFYSGKTKKTTRKNLGRMARDRGFDLAKQKFKNAGPEKQASMLKGSLAWQTRYKERSLERINAKLKKVRSKAKKYRLQREYEILHRAPVKSPLDGGRPQSSYVKRWWG